MRVTHPIATTATGMVRGLYLDGLRTWRGVPYGSSTAGASRFRAPHPPREWKGALDCTQFAPPALQGNYGPNDMVEGTEDCLTLDIVRPDTDDVLPVVVYLHGGTFITGASNDRVSQGHNIARDTNIVYVSLNFRLGVMGYLDFRLLGEDCVATPATHDQILALQWVRDNIAQFGGDPNRVTIMGESAGANAVTTLMCTPAAHGLFHGAIGQSTPVAAVHSRLQSAMWVRALLDRMGMSRLSTIDDLRAQDAEELARVGQTMTVTGGAIPSLNLCFMPTVDGTILPKHPLATFAAGEEAPVPMILGTNSGEASFAKAFFMRSRARERAAKRLLDIYDPRHSDAVLAAYNYASNRSDFAELVADAVFWAPSVKAATDHRKVAGTWMYRFDYAGELMTRMGLGAVHTADLEAVFGMQYATPAGHLNRIGRTNEFDQVREFMQYHWGHFFRHGRPGSDWPAYGFRQEEKPGRATAIINAQSTVVYDPKPDQRRAWEEFDMNEWGMGREDLMEDLADFLGLDDTPISPNSR
ncbi:carboxylesterase/lipase family protein [Corynebacterium aquatimens]|uniref:Carboxylic ester hydrolase n=1 Tax=Corynebacterium aquatimens TaxID=1190508 RepID=A0A931GSX9_9CORY|nr:carboxylesterase/lipase family protein [Corynebacterium aquatimens]MBG6121305.1 para-nitrobenzyl esterase [Corynebacterium aquatimens]WJY66145.1 Para-nitrobenzyl esterase [Corynebacterium aquatimens]